MKLKYRQLIAINTAINGIIDYAEKNNIIYKAKFSLFLIKNKKKIENELSILNDINKYSKEYTEKYEKEYIELLNKYSKKDENTPSAINLYGNMSLVIIDEKKLDEFNSKIEELNKKYPELAKEKEENLKRYNETLEQETEIDLFTIKNDEIPDIPVSLFNFIEDLIDY